MPRLKCLARIAILPAACAVFLMLAAGGCGDSSYPVDPEGGAKRKQARIDAYGPSGIPKAGKPMGPGSSGPNLGTQGAARQKAGQGGR